MRLPTASKAALVASCQFPWHPSATWTETRGKAAGQGNDFHEAVAALVDDTIPKPAPRGTKWLLDRLKHAQAWIDANYVRGWRAEEAYAYDPETGTSTLLGHNIGRAYEQHGRKPGELAGSADIIIPPAANVLDGDGGTVHIFDWKTSRFIVDSVWRQMEWLALFAARHYGVTTATMTVLHVTDSGVMPHTRDALYQHDLRRIEDDLRANLHAIPDSWPTAGDHCDAQFCPVRPDCDLYQLRKGRAA